MKLKISFVIIILTVTYYTFQYKSYEQTYKTIYQENTLNDFPTIERLKDGDIIFRRAYGVDSNIALNFSDGEKRYSHAGIIVKDINNAYVIHSLNDKKLNYNGVVKTPLQIYLDNIDIWAVYRYDIKDSLQNKVARLALKLKDNNIYFDDKFDLNTDDKMYCSEFIFKVVNMAAEKKIITAKKKFMGRTFVTISNLYENKYSKMIENSHIETLKIVLK